MLRFPRINRHAVGISALMLAIIGLGTVASMGPQRPVARLSEIGSAQSNQLGSATNPDSISQHFINQLRRIPKNAFGSAQPGDQPQTGVVWQPPEEIANNKPADAR